MQKQAHPAMSWSLDNVPYHDIDITAVRSREDLFYLVAGASFIEIAADLYTDNLIEYFNDQPEIMQWLVDYWKFEETRHGHVLRDYTKHVWPEFDWDRAYASFYADYSVQCTQEALEPSRCLEMAARCVVETGTATFYQALSGQANEPVLAHMASLIRADEISHYKHFYQYFRLYRTLDPTSRLKIFRAIARRVMEARNSDAETALWHVYMVQRNVDVNSDKTEFKKMCAQFSQQFRQYYPLGMAAKMLMRPLDLPKAVSRVVEGPLVKVAERVIGKKTSAKPEKQAH
ncbi:ferritin-like domain-containing protein [Advenella sp. RU8]|uniref:ferritin-like domain-containing protein n=1 Tax=Advenella sp. RU8 TaxID=3399575 RepID=UPI003AAF66CF